MADTITIVQQHSLSLDEARAAARQVADRMAEEYELACRWDGDVLHFGRSGLDGELALGANEARMQVKLGFLFGAFAGIIESKVAANMQKVFGGGAGG